MTTNEAAERLLNALPERHQWLADAALAAERRATVERIRAAVERQASGGFDSILTGAVRRILDEEAAR